MSRNLALIAALALAACGSGDSEPRPGGVTVGEARALDEAAEMIEARRVPPEVLRPVQPEANASQPDGAAR